MLAELGDRRPTTGDQRVSEVRAARVFAQPDRAGLQNNVAGNPAGDQTWELDAHVYLARIDHQFSPSSTILGLPRAGRW